MYKQRMHRSGRGLLNTKKRTERFMQVCFVGFLGGEKHKKLQRHLIDPYHFDASHCSKLGERSQIMKPAINFKINPFSCSYFILESTITICPKLSI